MLDAVVINNVKLKKVYLIVPELQGVPSNL